LGHAAGMEISPALASWLRRPYCHAELDMVVQALS
jgi:hypothetical protein